MIFLAAQFTDYIFTKIGNHIKDNWKYAQFINANGNTLVEKEISGSSSISYLDAQNQVHYVIGLSYSDIPNTFSSSDKNLKKVKIYTNNSYVNGQDVFEIVYANSVYFETLGDSINLIYDLQLPTSF